MMIIVVTIIMIVTIAVFKIRTKTTMALVNLIMTIINCWYSNNDRGYFFLFKL